MRNGKYILTGLVLLLAVFVCQGQQLSEGLDMFQKGLHHYRKCEYWEAYNCFVKVRNTYQVENNQQIEIEILKMMETCSFYCAEIDSCISCIERQLELIQLLKPKMAEYEEYEYVAYSNLYTCYLKSHDMEQAMQMSFKMDSLVSVSSDSLIKYHHIDRLCSEATSQNNEDLQEHYLLEKVKILKSIPNSKEIIEETIVVYNDLMDFYTRRKDYEKAERYCHDCIEIDDKNTTHFLLYGKEAILYANQNKRAETFMALDSMRAGLNNCGDANSRDWMCYYDVKGKVYGILQDWEASLKAYLTIVHTDSLSRHWGFDGILRFGNAYYHLQKFDKAREVYKIYAHYIKIQCGEWSEEYAQALWLLAVFETEQGNKIQGLDFYAQSVDVAKKIVKDQLRFVSPQERATYWKKFALMMHGITECAIKNQEQKSPFVENCYNAVLFLKSLLLESDRTMAEIINTQCTKEEKHIYYEMMNLQNEAKELVKDYKTNIERIDLLHNRITALNSQLTPIVSRLGYTDFLQLTYTDIKKKLGKNEMLIDFSDFVTDENRHQYVAFVINNKQQYPLLLECFSEEDICKIIGEKHIDAIYKQALATKIVQLVLDPLKKELKERDTIYYVPSGFLHKITLESLSMKDGTLLGAHYHFVRLTSAREIERVKSRLAIKAYSSATLYGGLKYDVDSAGMVSEASHYHINMWIEKKRGEPTRGSGRWDKLENTKEEIDVIASTLKNNHVSLTTFTGTKGTEESFFSMSGNAPQILHIATHGFYYTPEEAKKIDFLNGYQDAMQLTGLIMSGGNTEWTGKPIPKGVMGGVLTANDIATLDLRGTDLLVLSACQTGLGKVTPEGIYGLQRAFKKAGVQTIVMSLWNVSDVATKEFMVKFYEELTAGVDKWNKRKAFENAKNHIRNNPDYKDPYYWAGFVMLD